MLLLSGWREGTTQELIALDRQILHLGLGQRLPLFSVAKLVDSDLGSWLSLLTIGDVTARW